MSTPIYLRPLKIEDAEISYKWRNDPQVWTYTGFVPTQEITAEIEKSWLANALQKDQEKRFAVCIQETNEYVGNVQLIHIKDNTAEFAVFLGEKKYWGKGIGNEATKLMLDIAFNEFKLSSVYLNVHPDNIIAIRCYNRAGFKYDCKADLIKMVALAPNS